MDREDALRIARAFIDLVRQAGYRVSGAFLFGSAARGTAGPESDIDVAVILDGIENSFDAQVELMKLRRKIDTRIEPHAFHTESGDDKEPFLKEVEATGIRVA